MDIFNSIVETVVQYGVFAGLFISLFIYTIKNSKQREEKYISMISANSQALLDISNKISEITNNISEISKIQNDILNMMKNE